MIKGFITSVPGLAIKTMSLPRLFLVGKKVIPLLGQLIMGVWMGFNDS